MSSKIFSMFRMDEGLEKDGITVDYGDFKVVLARAGGSNSVFKKSFAMFSKPYRFQIDNGTISEDTSTMIMAETYAAAVVKNMLVKEGDAWVPGVPSEDGGVLEFTTKNVVELLQKLPDLFKDIQVMSQTASNFKKQEEAEDLKN